MPRNFNDEDDDNFLPANRLQSRGANKRTFAESSTEPVVNGSAKKRNLGGVADIGAYRQPPVPTPEIGRGQSSAVSKGEDDFPDFSDDESREIEQIMAKLEGRDDGKRASTAVKAPLKLDRQKTLADLTRHSSTFRANGVSKAVLDGAIGLREKWTPDTPVTHYTTRQVLAEEKAILNHAETLADTRLHFIEKSQLDSVLEQYDNLNDEQREAVRRVTEAEGFAILSGQAGTGKSAVLMAAHDAYEAAGRRVVGLAWTNDVVQQLKDGGFKYANTVSSELNSLRRGTVKWDNKTVVLIDEAAMLSNQTVQSLLCEAQEADTKVVFAGDDRQLSSIERGGMFTVLRNYHGGAELREILRVSDARQKQAFNYMHEGHFAQALEIFSKQEAIHWSRTQDGARADLVATWARDTLAAPEKKRLVFAYTNEDVNKLNAALRRECWEQNRLGQGRQFETSGGKFAFAVGDRLQFTQTDKGLNIHNGRFGTITSVDKDNITVEEDGGRVVNFNPKAFKDFRHGYAGTIYRGQGKTLHQTYLFHSNHWRAAASYVALTRHSGKTALFVAEATAKDIKALARQMERIDDRKPATQFLEDVDNELIGRMRRLNLGPRAGDKRKRMPEPDKPELRYRGDPERPGKRPKLAGQAERTGGPGNALLTGNGSGSIANRGLEGSPHSRSDQKEERGDWSRSTRTETTSTAQNHSRPALDERRRNRDRLDR